MRKARVKYPDEKVFKWLFYSLYSIIAACLLFFDFCNVEEPEYLVSASVAYEYMKPVFNAFFLDNNLFVQPILGELNKLFPGVQIYGYFLFLETLLIGYLILIYILNNQHLEKNRRILLASVFILLHIANFFLLSTTRIATLGIILFYILYHQKEASRLKLSLLFFFTLFLRIDAFALLSVLYIAFYIFIYRKVSLKVVIPFIGCVFFLLIYKFFVIYQLDEAFNVFYFRELDLIDRMNVLSTSELSIIDNVILDLLHLGSIEEEVYTLSFTNRVMSTKVSHLLNSILEPDLYLNTLRNSMENIKSMSTIMIMILTLVAFRILSVLQVNRRVVLYLLLILFPLVACFYVILPVRFLYPYLMIIILLILSDFRKVKDYLYLFMIIIIFQFVYLKQLYKSNVSKSDLFYKTMSRAEELKDEYGDFLVFESYGSDIWRFDNPNINYRYTGNHFLFLNYGFYSAIFNYNEKWSEIGCENPLSIYEKVKVLSEKNLPLIVDTKKKIELYEDYLGMRYDYHHKINHVLF